MNAYNFIQHGLLFTSAADSVQTQKKPFNFAAFVFIYKCSNE